MQKELEIITLLCLDNFLSPAEAIHNISHKKNVHQEPSLDVFSHLSFSFIILIYHSHLSLYYHLFLIYFLSILLFIEDFSSSSFSYPDVSHKNELVRVFFQVVCGFF